MAAEKYFTEVSNRTGGKSERLNIHASNASDNLADFIAHRIMEESASDEKMAENMKKIYEEERKRHKWLSH